MNVLISHSSNGVAYPGPMSRLFIPILLLCFFIHDSNLNINVIFYDENRLIFSIFLVMSIVINEWIFRIHIWVAFRFFEMSDIWKYLFVQSVFGIVLPGFIILLLNYISKAHLFKIAPLFPLAVLVVLNAIYFICYFRYTNKFVQHITVNTKGKTENVYTIDVIYFAFTGNHCLINHKDGRTFDIYSPFTIADFAAKLDPEFFILFRKNMIINLKFFPHWDKKECMN